MDYPGSIEKTGWRGGRWAGLSGGVRTGGFDGCRINELRIIGWKGEGGWVQRATERLETDLASVCERESERERERERDGSPGCGQVKPQFTTDSTLPKAVHLQPTSTRVV